MEITHLRRAVFDSKVGDHPHKFTDKQEFFMKSLLSHPTIAAISTPYGRGGIAVIRISGDGAVPVADRVFRAKSGKSLADTAPNTMVWGDIYHEGDIIDDGMAVVFRAPHSFTGEDTVEISCHGGIVLTATVLEAIFAAGAEAAGPGEFTKRAFMSGKLGLSQAEAVIELIDAENREKLKLSAAQARGILGRKINGFYEQIKQLLASVYVFIDYPDEDLRDVTPDEMLFSLQSLAADMDALIATYHTGRAIMDGISVAIVGKPNTGKSSFLNLLLGEERALVTDIAGTTRDTVEETLTLGKLTLRLCDTAGIRTLDGDTDQNRIEQLGIERSLQKLQGAELVLAVFDTARPFDGEDGQVMKALSSRDHGSVVAILNKSDLPAALSGQQIEEIKAAFPHHVEMSAKTGTGLSDLTSLIERLFIAGDIDLTGDAVVTNARQFSSLRSARECLSRAIDALKAGIPQDLAGLDLEQALTHLSELDGREVSEDIVSSIFHRFCVGK